MFLPTTRSELNELGWDNLDIILITGDTYIDSSYIGVSVIGKVLTDAGYRVGIIAQPDVNSKVDITRLGEPKLLWGITAGCVDSMVANYTATRKRRKNDDYTPGVINNRRPDRATIVYANLIRRYFKNTKPIVLGGIEASLRRIAHYDYWSDKIRKSILFDAKADYLVYGMGESAILELAECLRHGKDPSDLKGLCYISKEPRAGYIEQPSFNEVKSNSSAFIEMFRTFDNNSDPISADGLYQKHDARYLVQNPPAENATSEYLDRVYELDYEDDVHPYYKSNGEVRALDTIRFSITTHRGCYGKCNFCAISSHQGTTVISRSEESIVAEATRFTQHPKFKGIIKDVGGPTANMYGFECALKLKEGCCKDKLCLFPTVCKPMKPDHKRQIDLLRKLRRIKGVRKLFIASGIRHDLALADKKHGYSYIKEVVTHHVSGQMKLAPEHSDEKVLAHMGKPGTESLLRFRKLFNEISRSIGKKQFLTYYIIAAHPGCSEKEMLSLRGFLKTNLKILPEQVQVFTPLPSTWSAVMYYTGIDPFSGGQIVVEKDNYRKEKQKRIITG